MLLSVCIIVRDGATFISRTIGSVKNISDEIVVIDTGSYDNTQMIAHQAGARVISYQWQHDFSRIRNYALKQARGDWVLFLDSDEEMSRDCNKLRPILTRVNCRGYYLPVIEMGNEQKFPRLVPRLLKQSRKLVFQGRVDEQLNFSVFSTSTRPEFKVLQIPILHHDIHQVQTELKPDDIYKLNGNKLNKVSSYYEEGRYKLALNELELRLKEEDVKEEYSCLSDIIFLLLNLDNIEKARDVIRCGQRKYPSCPDFDFWQGFLDYRLRKYRQGIKSLLQIFNKDTTDDFLNNTYVLLGELYKKVDNYAMAINFLEKSNFISRAKKFIVKSMIEIFIEQGYTLFDILDKLPDQNKEVYLMLLDIFVNNHHYQKGLELIDIIEHKYDNLSQLIFWKGKFLLYLGQKKLASKELKKISPGFVRFDEVLDLLWVLNLEKDGSKAKSNLNQIKLLGDNLSWKFISLYNKINNRNKEIRLDFKNLNLKYEFYYKCFYYLELLLKFAGDDYIEIVTNIIESLQVKSVYSDLGNIFYNYQKWERAEYYLKLSLEEGVALKDLVKLAGTFYHLGKKEDAVNLYQKVLKYDCYNLSAYKILKA